ncbi:MAG: rod shape-determining protein MreC [Chloroflexi bacterium]|nr:rod shape-determining protein MreC [Chloroflexota bacterium]
MRRRTSSIRLPALTLLIIICVALIVVSGGGGLDAIRGVIAAPFEFLSGLISRGNSTVDDISDLRRTYDELTQYVADLETTLAQLTAEVVALREIGADYQRLADLVNYVSQVQDQEVVAADVIARDTVSALRTVSINRGARDGVRVGSPVVTGQGLVGRVVAVSANAARVQLINSEFSAISARLETSRVEGSVIGQASGNLRMTLLPQGANVQVGDLVRTSGLGGNLPPDIVIGQVTSTRQFESDIEQTAEVRSFIDFDRLEIVLVVTSFEPIDLSIFEPTPVAP